MVDGHECNVFCRDGRHTDLVRVTPGLVNPEAYLARWFAQTHGVTVHDVRRVEAPSPDAPLPTGLENRLEYGDNPEGATEAHGITWSMERGESS